jgi:hypothetical protein
MKMKILLFANLVLIGSVIALHVGRSSESNATPNPAGKPAQAPIPPETPPPWNETASNVSPESVDATKSNAVPQMAPRARHDPATQGLSQNAKRPVPAEKISPRMILS